MLRVKADDTAVVFTAILTVDGVPVDLTGAEVLFLIESEAGQKIQVLAEIVDPLAGSVQYQVTGLLQVLPGRYRQEWQVTFADSGVLTFPNGTYNRLEVLADLN